MKRSVKDYYSPYKVFHHRDKIHDLKNNRMPPPCQVQVDLDNRCSHSCVYCYYTYAERGEEADNNLPLFRPTDYIDGERALNLMDELKEVGVIAVSLTGGGEPTLHPYFDKVVERINKNNMKWSLTTNGSMIHKKGLTKLLTTATWVRFSMDAATEETYNASQRPSDTSDFYAVLNNIKNLIKYKRETVVGMSFVINPINYKEVYDFVKLGKRMGVDNVRISLVYTSKKADIHKDYWSDVLKQIDKAKELEDDNFKVFAMTERYNDLQRNEKDYDYCWFHHFTTTIGANLDVYYCCTTKYQPGFVIGNLKDNTFNDVWFGKDHLDSIKNFDIRKCPNCWFDGTNRIIDYMMLDKEDVPHVGWV